MHCLEVIIYRNEQARLVHDLERIEDRLAAEFSDETAEETAAVKVA